MEPMAQDIAKNKELYTDLAFMLGFPIARTPEEFSIGFLSKLPVAGEKIAGVNEAMFTAVMRGMKNMYQDEVANLLKLGADPTQAKAVAADAVTKVLPLLNPARLGQSEARAKLIRSSVISVSFIRKPMELVSDATLGYVRLLSGLRLTPKQRL